VKRHQHPIVANTAIIAAEIDSRIPIRSPFGLPVHVFRPANSIVEDVQAALAQFAEIAADLKRPNS
jgi:hypothetical protein